MGFKQFWNEGKNQSFVVHINKLYSPLWKIKETVSDIESGKPSQSPGPITISKMGDGKYYVMDGNHRVVEAIQNGQTFVDALLNPHLPDMTRSGGGYDNFIKDAVQIVGALKGNV